MSESNPLIEWLQTIYTSYLLELICPLIYISNSHTQVGRRSQHFQLGMTNTKSTTNTKKKIQ